LAHQNRVKIVGGYVGVAFAAILALSLWPGVEAAAERGASKAASKTVVIDAVAFAPESITVHVGDKVTWINKDPFPHMVTSKEGGFDSREIAAGKSWSFTPRKAGAFAYVCTLHPTMKGVLRVE